MGNDGSVERRPRIALVLSGGGARGAYEAGVLSYLVGDVSRRLSRPVHFDIITGSSVGGVHACYMAATQQDPGSGEGLAAIWRSLSFEAVFPIGAADLVRLPWRLLGFGEAATPPVAASEELPQRLPALLDTRGLESLVLGRVPWPAIRRNLDEGQLDALALTTTEVTTGRSVVFVDNANQSLPQWARDPFIIGRSARIGPAHALASAAIPLLFPPVRIGQSYYCDGGLRLNTPLAPALRLGADRVLIIGLRHRSTAEDEDRAARRPEANYMSLTYLAGKALDALLLDRVETDVDRLRLFNAILESGIQAYGPEFIDRINEPILALRNTSYRVVRDLYLTPSEDLSAIAASCLLHQPRSGGIQSWLSRNIARYVARGAVGEADLLSYLFFDRCYAEHLIALGRHDAEQASDELAAFLS